MTTETSTVIRLASPRGSEVGVRPIRGGVTLTIGHWSEDGHRFNVTKADLGREHCLALAAAIVPEKATKPADAAKRRRELGA